MSFPKWLHRHRRAILLFFGILAAGGIVAGFALPVSLFPRVDFPRIVVGLEAGDQPAEQMELDVTRTVEEAVRAVPGVVSIRSTTSRGSAEISVNFTWNVDMIAALLQIQAAVGQALSDLPPGTKYTVTRMDPTVFPALAYSLYSDRRSLVELRDIARYQLTPFLSTVQGVSKVQTLGGEQEEISVWVQPERLASYGLSLSDVTDALASANVLSAVGRVEDHYKLYLVLSENLLTDTVTIGNIVLRAEQNGFVRLKDVAVVKPGSVPQWRRVTSDGRDAVLFQVYQQPGGNTVRIAQELKSKLAEFQTRLPPDVRIANWYDQSELILAAASSVYDAVGIGIILAVVILLLFLRNWKTSMIAVLAVPIVLASSLLVLELFGMSFNIMTLGGMAAAVGLILDDTIVMLEHIMRRLHETTGDRTERVFNAAREFTWPLVGSSASTIVIFIPLAFLSGVTGAFFKALSVTMASGLLISFFVAWWAVPVLTARFLGERDAIPEKTGRMTRVIHAKYDALLGRLLRRPSLLLPVILILMIAGLFAYENLNSGFIPTMDEGGFILDYRTESGTSLTETDRLLRQVEEILRATPEVSTYSRRTGLQLGGGLTEANEGDFFVRLKSQPRRPIEEIMDEVRGKVERTIPGIDVEMAQLMEDLIGDLTAVPQPVEILIYSDDGELLQKLGPKVATRISQIPGVVDIRNGVVLAGDALEIHVDPILAAREGVNAGIVTHQLDEILSGSVATEVRHGPKAVGVRIWVPGGYRERVLDLPDLRLRAPDGHLFPLGRIASVKTATGQPQIRHDNLKRMVAVTARITGRDMGSVIRDVQAVLKSSKLLPTGVYTALGGLYAEQQIAFRGLLAVFAAAVLLVLLLLVALYEHIRLAAAILSIPLLAICVVFVGMWATGTELNISSMMGLTMIVGIVTEVGIFYVSEYRELEGKLDGAERMITAGKNRMRPIAMTTLAAILALLPLAAGLGQGSAMLQPLAIAIVFGLVAQFPLVLIVLPTLIRMANIPAAADR